jgi:hypothetical protein
VSADFTVSADTASSLSDEDEKTSSGPGNGTRSTVMLMSAIKHIRQSAFGLCGNNLAVLELVRETNSALRPSARPRSPQDTPKTSTLTAGDVLGVSWGDGLEDLFSGYHSIIGKGGGLEDLFGA